MALFKKPEGSMATGSAAKAAEAGWPVLVLRFCPRALRAAATCCPGVGSGDSLPAAVVIYHDYPPSRHFVNLET